MKTRTIALTAVLTVLFLLVAAIPTLAQEPVRAQNVIIVAHPRAGIANPQWGGAENFLLGNTTADSPLATPEAHQRLRLQGNFEAVFFPRAAGWARFEMAVFEIQEGTRTLIGRSAKRAVGVGPTTKSGSLHVDVRFDEPGLHEVAVVATTTAQPLLAPAPVVDEDEMTAFILVPGEGTGDDITGPAPAAPAPPESQGPSLARSLADPNDPPPDDNTRLVQVASPRGHAMGMTASDSVTAIGAVENFDLGHGKTVAIHQGGTIRFRSGPYELVWFDGAAATASTALDILRVDSSGNPESLGSGGARFENVTAPHRERGAVDVDVVFDQVGTFEVLARIRTELQTPDGVSDAGLVDEDEVRMRVRVGPGPEVGSIAGVVTAEDSTLPLAGILVQAFDAETGRPAGEGHSGDDGAYLIQNLRAGSYIVRAEPREQNYLPEFYDDAQTREEATRVPVGANQTTDHIDFALAPGGTISGRITRESDDAPMGNVVVQVGKFDSNRVMGMAHSLEDGTYAVDHLPAGSYWVHAGGSRAEPGARVLR